MFNHSHIRHFSSLFVSLRDFELITQNSSENITSRQSRCIYVIYIIIRVHSAFSLVASCVLLKYTRTDDVNLMA